MSGSPADPRPVSAQGYRPYRVQVRSRLQLSPTFVRMVFTGPDLDIFGTDGLDQRIKLVFPNDDGTFVDLGLDDPAAVAAGDWYQRWLRAPDQDRNPIRTYTVRGVDPVSRELTVDFAVHGTSGPGSRFAAAAAPGDPLIVVGPDARSPLSGVGIDFHPGPAGHILLAGDETAVPAICAVLEQFSARTDGPHLHALLEVPHPDDAVPVDHGPTASVTWLNRRGVHGAELVDAVSDYCTRHLPPAAQAAQARGDELEDVDVDQTLLWEVPEQESMGDFHAWVAGEAGVVRTLRRLLVRDFHVDRGRVAFMGYWRLGRSETT